MVDAVVDPKSFEDIIRRLKNMDHVMNGQVGRVPHQHARQKSKHKITQNHPENQKQNRRERDAEERRHRQTAFVPRKFMMDTMHDILDFLPGFGIGVHVKYKTVQHVLEPGVEKYSGKK